MDKLKQHIQDNREQMDVNDPLADMWKSIHHTLTTTKPVDALKEHIGQNTGEWEIDQPDHLAWDRIAQTMQHRQPGKTVSLKKIWWYAAAACLVVLVGYGMILYFRSSSPGKTGTEMAAVPPQVKNDPDTKPAIENPAQDNSKDLAKATPMESDTIINPVSTDTAATMFIPAQPQKEWEVKTESTLAKNSQPVFTAQERSMATNRTKASRRSIQAQLPPAVVEVQNDYNDLIAAQINYIQKLPVYGEQVEYFESFVLDFRRLDGWEKQLRKSIADKGMQETSIDELAMIYQQKLMILKRLQAEIAKTSDRSRNTNDTIPAYIRL